MVSHLPLVLYVCEAALQAPLDNSKTTHLKKDLNLGTQTIMAI